MQINCVPIQLYGKFVRFHLPNATYECEFDAALLMELVKKKIIIKRTRPRAEIRFVHSW